MENIPDLPMTVWLKGDESFFQDFGIQAEDAMKILNIKRSRLNQISGKELRVGRTRIDRYIKPVFRQEDVDGYLAWTRATATHQKSSGALEEARKSLEFESQKLLDELTDYQKTIPFQIGQETLKYNESLRKSLEDKINEYHHHFASLLTNQTLFLSQKISELGQITTHFEKSFATLQASALVVPQILANQSILLQSQHEQQKSINEIKNQTLQISSQLSENQSKLSQPLRTFKASGHPHTGSPTFFSRPNGKTPIRCYRNV